MMITLRRIFYLSAFVLFFSTAVSVSAEHVTVQLHLAITEATGASAPQYIDNHLVLTYKGARKYRFVGAAFEHEDFKIIHPFYINTNGVYVLTYPVQDGLKEIDYRLVVDGLWMTDPRNLNTTKGSDGITFSSFNIPAKTGPPESPQIKGGMISFTYYGSPGQRVYVYGDFNNWDPYMFRMKESQERGVYTFSLRAAPGNYKYKFIVDGTSFSDPLNDLKTIDIFGKTASMVTVPSGF